MFLTKSRKFIATAILCLLNTGTLAEAPVGRKPTEFWFARLEYTGHSLDQLKSWSTDYPFADEHIVTVLNRITNIRADSTSVKIGPAMYRYPFLYIVEPEQMLLDSKEAAYLHEWLARGGTLMMDDFHGNEEFAAVEHNIGRIWPGAVRVELQPLDPIWHSFFEINKFEQVVNDSINACRPDCEQWENGPSGKDPKFFAWYDANDLTRILILAAYNTDLGDGIEWADDAAYQQWMSAYSFRVFANSVLWTLGH